MTHQPAHSTDSAGTTHADQLAVQLEVQLAAQLDVMRRAWGDDAIDDFTRSWPELECAIADAGFVIDQLLGGGVMSVVAGGTHHGRPAVAKISPDADKLRDVVAIINMWGPDCTVEVYAQGDSWAIFSNGGPQIDDHADDRHARDMLGVLERLHQQPHTAGIAADPSEQRVKALIDMAERRPASAAYHQRHPGQLETRAALLTHTNAVICHGDTRNNNWVISDKLRLIDPDPFHGPPAADIARWAIGAGPQHTTNRAELLTARPDRHDIAAWLRFWAIERTGALAHHGYHHARLDETVRQADAAADLLDPQPHH